MTFYRAQSSATAVTSATAQAFCAPGDLVTGGGFFDVEPTSFVEHNMPLNEKVGGIFVPRAWSVTVRANGVTDSFTAYAVCADLTP